MLLGEGAWRILAGGTDFYPALGARPLTENVLDINGLSELRGIAETPTHYVIGARTSWTDIVRAPLPPSFDALKQAAREVGSVQIQNAGTVAGNICNASPAADGVPALLVLDAEVELACSGGKRHEPLESFVRGNRRTSLRAGRIDDRDPPAQDIARRRVVLLEARCAALPRDLDRHDGGADCARRRRQPRRGRDRGRRVLGRGPAPARPRRRVARQTHPARSPNLPSGISPA